ncbi:MAG: PhzF family phenazine biosynthesis isomerase [Gammaproteobacteria bacterium]|nr:PhzF family phenazine biosynthesis isomerase [Gammaproteobacteria bacterium]
MSHTSAGLRVFQVDAFTRTRYTGNPAMVVLDADGLDERSLGDLAREFAHAETAFVLSCDEARADLRLRFFNARKEAPFVGHATIAAHAVLLALGRRRPGVCCQLSGTGPIDVMAFPGAGEGDAATIEFRQAKPDLDAPLPLKTTLRVAEALGLAGARLHDELPARVGRRGSTRLLVPVADAYALDELVPHMDGLTALGREIGVDGFFAFAWANGAQGPSTESRMFCPALGIPEDPVSGNAHAMLAAYLFDAGLIGAASPRFTGRQGSQMRRPGQVSVTLELEHGALHAVRIGGSAVIVCEGRLAV